MTEKLLITIGITAYREGNYLQNAWDSIKNQTSSYWNAVMVLDGGADKTTRSIFDKISHPNLKKIIQKENMGPYHCRTIAIQYSSTPWYFHLDADDCLPQKAIKHLLEHIYKFPELDYFWGKCLFFSKRDYFVSYVDVIHPDHQARGNQILGTSPIKIRMFKELNGFHRKLYTGGADWEFWTRVLTNGYKGKFINEILYERRISKNSVGDQWLLRGDKVAEIIIDNNPDFFMEGNRKNECMGRSYELISRKYRSIGKRKKASEYAVKAREIGWQFDAQKVIIIEMNMTLFRFFIRRLRRLLSV